MTYDEFLRNKVKVQKDVGINPDTVEIPDILKPHQKDSLRFALRCGRALLALSFGLGKTIIQASLAKIAHENTGQKTLTICPLGVRQEFTHPSTGEPNRAYPADLGVHYQYCTTDSEIEAATSPYIITNYERVRDGDIIPDKHNFCLVSLDEASIIGNLGTKTYAQFEELLQNIPYKYICTATPAPNEYRQLIYYANILGVMTNGEALTRFFGRDVNKAGNLQLLPQYEEEFWLWVSTWALFLYKPSDLGYSDVGYELPELNVYWHRLPVDHTQIWNEADNHGQYKMLSMASGSVNDMHKDKHRTMLDRMAEAKKIIDSYPETGNHNGILLWHDYEYERQEIESTLRGYDIKTVYGSQDLEKREQSIVNFQDGKYRILATKPVIAGSGCNFQHWSHVNIFLGVSYCYDDQTEILTRNGWKKFSELNKEISVATVNQETLNFEWQKPTDIIYEKYSGKMIHFSNRGFDLLVTPNHNMFVKRCENRYRTSSGKFELVEAKSISGRYRVNEFRMMSTAIWKDNSENVNSVNIEGFGSIDIETFIMLSGWYISEGWCQKDGSIISLAQSVKKPENRQEIIDVIKKIGINYTEYKDDIKSFNKKIAQFLINTFGDSSHAKHIPEWIKNLPINLLVLLRDTMCKGDGTYRKDKYIVYTTVSKQLADDFQEICIKTGIRAYFKESNYVTSYDKEKTFTVYNVNMSNINTTPYISNKPKEIEYNGYIGCVSVPNRTVIVRRNGKAVVSGNSFKNFIQSVHRTHRFMQSHPVDLHIIYSESEDGIVSVLKEKWEKHNKLTKKMQLIVQEYGLSKKALEDSMQKTLGVPRRERNSTLYKAYNNDNTLETRNMPENSVDLIVTSIPFDNHYEYTTVVNDFSFNDNDFREPLTSGFWQQMDYLTPELLRVTKPGRKAVIHVKDRILYSYQVDHGLTSTFPFSDETVMHFLKHGWVYEGRRTIVTDVVRENNSTYRLGYSEMSKDASKMGSGLPEYLLTFRKPNTDKSQQYADDRIIKIKYNQGEKNFECGNCGYKGASLEKDFEFAEGEKLYTKYQCPECGQYLLFYSRAKWQIDAHSFWQSNGNILIPKEWYDYDAHAGRMETLDFKGNLSASYLQEPPVSHNDMVWDDVVFMQCLNSNQTRRRVTNHVCPLPLDIVRRSIILYSNFNETVYDPFAGLFTVPYLAIQLGRIGIGCELNADYYNDGVVYCNEAEQKKLAPTLFDLLKLTEETN